MSLKLDRFVWLGKMSKKYLIYNTMEKAYCRRKIKHFSIVTVTDKGQIAIPSLLREECKVERGDKLIVIKRDDGRGFNLLKVDILGDFLNKASED